MARVHGADDADDARGGCARDRDRQKDERDNGPRRVRRRTAKRGDRRNGHSRDHTDRRGLTPAGLGNTGHKPHLRSPTDATIIAYL